MNDGATIGLYNLATLPYARGRGIGEAVMRYALDTAHSRSPASGFVLQSTPPGYELYRRAGFEDVGRIFVYTS